MIGLRTGMEGIGIGSLMSPGSGIGLRAATMLRWCGC